MRTEFIKKCIATTACFVICVNLTSADELAAGLAVIGPDSIEIGELKDYNVKSALFKLKNESAETIRIEEFVPTCSCVIAKADKEELEAGAETPVRVTLSGSTARPGAFNHGVWVHASDNTRLKLSLTGKLIPLFTGLPETTEMIASQEGETIFTNRYVLTASEEGVSLGVPEVTASENLKIDLSVTTNQGERVNYDITVVLAASGEGRRHAMIHFPVLGKEDVDTKSLDINFSVAVGKSLKVVPNRLLVSEGAQLRLLISDRKRKLDASLLTWEPRPDGLDVRSQESRLGQGLVVTVTMDAKAAATLVAAGKLGFNYPGYQAVEVPVLGR